MSKNHKKSDDGIRIKVTIGKEFCTAKALKKALKSRGRIVSECSNDFIGKIDFPKEAVEVNLVILTTAELTGKEEGGTTTAVLAGAKKRGLQKCPSWVGPIICLGVGSPLIFEKDQWLLIGMDPVVDSDGDKDVFTVGRDNKGIHIVFVDAYDEDPWSGDDHWVFVDKSEVRE